MSKRKARHPVQPLIKENDGMIRFKRNAIVRFLMDWGSSRGMSLNDLAILDFSNEDWEQFAQLIGYSLRGFSELSYVSNKTYKAASEQEVLRK